MAFSAGGTNYQGFLESRRLADVGVTSSLKAQGEAEKRARIKKSGERSGIAKLGSAVVRGAAAYYTGGMSEQMGAGSMIDEAMLGTDSEGKAVRNEYGEMVGVASQVGGAMSAKKGAEAAKKLQMQSQKDDAMQTRLDNLDPTGRLGMNFATKREERDSGNLKALQAGDEGSFPGLFQGEIKGINYEPTTIGDWEAQLEKNKGGIMNTGDAETIPIQGAGSTLRGLDTTPKTSTPDPIVPDAVKGSTSFGVPDTSRDVQPISAAETYKAPNSQYQLQGDEMKREQDDLISRLTDDTGGTPPVITGKPWEEGYGEGFRSNPQFKKRKSNEGWTEAETGNPWKGQ